MTTAATSLLGLALPVTGELSGTWGDTVNTSITALLDSAVAGTTTLSADGDVTLTTTTLATNQARQATILWTAGGTATRYITAPAHSKTYIVINNTSSTQSIVLRGAGPTTGVTVLAGRRALVVWDGTDFVEGASGNVAGPASATDNAVARFDGATGKVIQNSVVTIADTTGNMAGVGTISSGAITSSSLTSGRVLFAGTSGLIQDDADLTFDGNKLTVGNILDSGLTASQAVFTDASKNLVSNAITGTGNVVMSTSPTLVTPALGTPSALVGTNITGTATNFTASNVTTNANLTGAVTSVGNAALLGSFTSSQLATALTDETGSGSAVFATSPTLVTPALGIPTSGNFSTGTFTWPTFNQNTTGNAATATILATARTIGGVSFDGSANINLAGVNTAGNQNTSGTAAGLSATLAIASGGTGLTSTPANGALDIGNGTGFTRTTLTQGTGVTITNASGAITISATGGTVTSVAGTAPVASSGGTTPDISLAAAYGDTQNPYASKTANYVLAAPNGSAGAPTFRAIVAADIPTLNQNTTGNAATATILATARNIGGVSFNGSADINLPGVNTAGNQNTSGNAATATVLQTANFSIQQVSGKLYFYYGATAIASMDSSGNLVTLANVTAFGTP